MSDTSADRPLKLRARDTEDYRVLSAVLQDALVPVRDMDQLPRERRFVMVVNRFRWEARAPLEDLPDLPRQEPPEAADDAGDDARFEDAPLYQRVHAGVAFDRVRSVAFRGFSRQEGERVLELLAVLPDAEGVTLAFAEDAAVRLQGAGIVCHLEDLGEPWPTRWRPDHSQAAGEADAPAHTGHEPSS
ncbi:Protein of unknown function [Limimonas halophila]|uniref:DUF2948 domain-containing protein n=1 Tax=Limimonas halophila TaxID=1082479 RepID=A0A1G7QLH1_9PROT|nr:DUF2948 family protein [Limimonas halophila]SDF99325.1 Protein of unknown function [Limimonas halophila]